MSITAIIIIFTIVIALGAIIWALIERAGKSKQKKKTEDAEIRYQTEHHQKEKLKDNINDILDYESTDDRIKHGMETRIKEFKEARSETATKEQIDKLRSDLFDICSKY